MASKKALILNVRIDVIDSWIDDDVCRGMNPMMAYVLAYVTIEGHGTSRRLLSAEVQDEE